jgi:hypothetical protein
MKQILTRAAVIVVGLAVLTVTVYAQTVPPKADPSIVTDKSNSLPLLNPFDPGVNWSGYGAAWKYQAEEQSLLREANDLVRKLGEAKTDNDKEKVKGKLGDVLEKQFDLRQKRHNQQIEALEAQVKKLKELVEKRKENRKEIVSKRLDQLQREAQGLGW